MTAIEIFKSHCLSLCKAERDRVATHIYTHTHTHPSRNPSPARHLIIFCPWNVKGLKHNVLNSKPSGPVFLCAELYQPAPSRPGLLCDSERWEAFPLLQERDDLLQANSPRPGMELPRASQTGNESFPVISRAKKDVIHRVL